MNKFILFFVSFLCILSCNAPKGKGNMIIGIDFMPLSNNSVSNNPAQNSFPNFSDTLYHILHRNPPKWINNCHYGKHYQLERNELDLINNLLLQKYAYTLTENDPHPPPPDVCFPSRRTYSCEDLDASILYYHLSQEYIICNKKDLVSPEKRYLLKSFLQKNKIIIKDYKRMLVYLIRCYEGRWYQKLVFWEMQDFNQMPLCNRAHDVMTKDELTFMRFKIKQALAPYQKESDKYVCTLFNNLGEYPKTWRIYLLVIPKNQPMNYEVIICEQELR